MLGDALFQIIRMPQIVAAVRTAQHIDVEGHGLVLRYAISTSLNGYSGQTEEEKDRAGSITPHLLHRRGEILEVPRIGEVLVHAGEADIGDAVQAFQPFHHHLSDRPRRNLSVARRLQLPLDARNQLLQPAGIDWPLPARDPDGARQLVAVEGFLAPLALHHPYVAKLYPLEGGEARAAGFALPTTTDGGAILRRTAVLHLAVFMGAKGAAQATLSFVDGETGAEGRNALAHIEIGRAHV